MVEQISTEKREFQYSQVNYVSWLNMFASVLGCEVANQALYLPAGKGTGFAKSFMLEDGFSACVNNYSLDEPYAFTRHPTERFGVIIYLYHFHIDQTIGYKVGNEMLTLEEGHHYSLYVINSQMPHEFFYGKNKMMRGLSIYLENEWIEKNIDRRLVEVFDYLKQVNYFKQFINAKQQRLMNEVVDMPDEQPCPDIYIKSRLFRMLDKVLESFLQRDISESPERISEDDFKTLQQIEAILTNACDTAFPGIEKLSRISLMSESKLKKLFKQSFGMGLYEYFQKNRMHKAKEQILSGKYSISEVGTRLGYQNLSNFSTAFRKEFQCLPSEIALH